MPEHEDIDHTEERCEPAYTGTEQWLYEGFCEFCRRQKYCSKKNGEGCTARRNRIGKEKTKGQIEAYLQMGLTPDQLGLDEEILKEYGIEWMPPASEEGTEPPTDVVEVEVEEVTE